MTPAQFIATVQSIDLDGAPCRLHVFGDYDHARMRGILGVSVRAPGRDTGVMGTFAAAVELTHKKVLTMSAPELVDAARAMCRKALLHELDEHFRVDGELRFDPHAREAA